MGFLMVKCPKCGSENDNINVFCLDCGNNLNPLLETSKFNKKAILLGIISWIPLFIIWSWTYYPFSHIMSVYAFAYTLSIVQLISSFITGYTADKLYVRNSILNGLVVAVIFSIIFIILGGIIPVFISIIIFGGLGGGLGGYLKIQRKLRKK